MNIQSEKYQNIGEQIIQELFPQLTDVRIAWLESDKDKKTNGKIVFAECAKVPERYDWCCPYDFTITVFEPNVERFTDDQIKILLEHELMHIGTDKENYYVVPHDIEEFMGIIEKYGIRWQEDKTDYALLD